ncbi:NgoFVII family restriction endonuclease [Desulfuromonas acetoxidans]|uniref:Restriction endonuclease type II NgoFVII N-terminal domain-containing protein n=1 Tax=Desulfuromonas acetoxidans (strain DSM 684 / 11070) TaxID=281689 RepID=Q1K352_DESA6|nr:phospholipase D family protein [Desulfuromonas acetoxidans]EAT17122.1 hypothetical protein Dace_2988 [Desulfuromonas acetoxidans DSM 684]MBF0645654.1 phospholipase D family protein [Desulfuromonas acetoxidans]NVD24129.1 NgoFVII family restriction endonuclease [Desulfuromonas acetoxidans]NVE16425.1 NgoFVII family restriction endonuclease [Desulfuromonas acetoxidans]
MKLLINSRKIERALVSLMNQYENYYIASAWASVGTDAFETLSRNSDKISKLIVGTHFYQTHPDFIQKFYVNENARFVKKTGGVFHPKIYLFVNSESNWECLIGSANFTRGAFSINSEAMLHVNSSDTEAREFFNQIIEQFAKYWNDASSINEEEIENYRSVWKSKQKTIKKLKGQYGTSRSRISMYQSRIFSLSWAEYFELVQIDPFHSFNNRLLLLNEARSLFDNHSSFSEMVKEDRRKIAGLHFEEQPNGYTWAWFGSMKGAGKFQNKINTNNEFISRALDCIPKVGSCNRNEYFTFVRMFESAFQDGGAGVAIASRLLAMKRPDYFLCLDNKNKENLCKEFGISKNITFEKYWDEIIERLIDSVWWNQEAPEDTIQLRLWKGRAAMLDAVFYDENI